MSRRCGAVLLLLACRPENPPLPSEPEPDSTESSSPLPAPVVLLGMDGLDRVMLDRLMESGELPHFQRLADEGILTDLSTTRPILSPIIWTSIATGYGVDGHGIAGWARSDGSAFTSLDISATPIWSLASDAGLQVFVAGWLMSWPAREVRGQMLTDRLVLSFPMNKDPEDESVAISQRTHRSEEALSWPLELTEQAQEWIPDTQEAPEGLAHQLKEFDAPFHPWVRDETQVRAFESTWPESGAHLGMVYLASADQVSHLYWPFTDGLVQRQLRADPEHRMRAAKADTESRSGRRSYPYADAPISPAQLAEGATWVPEIYRWLDEALGRVMDVIDPETTTLILCSDHGFQTGRKSPTLNGGHRDPGVLGLWGGATRPGQSEPAQVLDLNPTLLRLLKLPLAIDMPGHALATSLSLPPAANPVPSSTREPSRAPLPDGGGGEPHMQQLEALGYVDAEGKPLPGSSRIQGQTPP